MNKFKKIKFVLLTILSILTTNIVINKIIFVLAKMKDLLYSKNGNYYQWRFGKIFYTKQGKGSPLLLIHQLDYLGSDIEWKYVVESLSKNYTVYTIDLLGCGRSDKPSITYTSYLYVQLINDFIKNIIGTKTNVMATSTSASIAIMACHTESSLFEKMILINPENFNIINKIPITRHKIYKFLLDLPIIGTTIYIIKSSKNYIKKEFSKKYYYCSYKAKYRIIDSYYEAAHLSGSSSKYLFSSIKAHYNNSNISHALMDINNSIYIIGGDHEPSIEETIKQYLDLNPSIEYSLINNTKHLPQLEQPEKIIDICNIFV